MDDRTGDKKVASKKWFVVLQIGLTVAALGFAGWQISKYTGDLNIYMIMNHWYLMIPVILLYVSFYIVLAIHWQFICKIVDVSHSRNQWIAFFASQPYKYLPTSLFTFTFRGKFAKQLGLGYKLSSQAQIIENASMITSAGLIAFFAWMIVENQLILAIAGVLVACSLFIVFLPFLQKLIRHREEISLNKRITMLGISSIAWVIAGTGLFILLNALGNPSGFINSIGANSAAFGLGILAIFAPGGLGVRELAFSFFAIGATTIVTWRFVTMIVDLLVGPAAWGLLRNKSKKS